MKEQYCARANDYSNNECDYQQLTANMIPMPAMLARPEMITKKKATYSMASSSKDSSSESICILATNISG